MLINKISTNDMKQFVKFLNRSIIMNYIGFLLSYFLVSAVLLTIGYALTLTMSSSKYVVPGIKFAVVATYILDVFAFGAYIGVRYSNVIKAKVDRRIVQLNISHMHQAGFHITLDSGLQMISLRRWPPNRKEVTYILSKFPLFGDRFSADDFVPMLQSLSIEIERDIIETMVNNLNKVFTSMVFINAYTSLCFFGFFIGVWMTIHCLEIQNKLWAASLLFVMMLSILSTVRDYLHYTSREVRTKVRRILREANSQLKESKGLRIEIISYSCNPLLLKVSSFTDRLLEYNNQTFTL
eukprot:TRINITY_DN6856_c0_g2_i3.p1 TRINITY_DN6856_c0_g2~~TRINITY_DN6856_c0_g2_i3.p1  ORF type:complete len:295 (-),score=12.17 TRINITY_DN6856_c0_g2_i3:117-1001(-)